MRIVMRLVMALLVVALAACSARLTPESDRDEVGNGATLVLVTPEREDAYPAPDTAEGAYPAVPLESELPTGYPEEIVTVPAGEVDLSDVPTAAPGGGPQLMPAPGRPTATLSAPMARLLAAVIDDLSQRSDTPVEKVRLLAARPTVWANGALGCPAEGMAYIEVIIEGMLFTLEADGATYTYHTDDGHNFVLCGDGVPLASGSVSQ